MIKSLFNRNPNFIEVYDNALSKKECQILINQFEKSNKQYRGIVSTGYDPDQKNCMQLSVDLKDQSVTSNIIRSNLISCMKKYKGKHECVTFTSAWDYYYEASFQKYDGKEDGYKVWHCEQDSGLPFSERIMAWMFYLNDAKCGTEFYNHSTIKAKAGRCVMWPAYWTHAHRGVIPNVGLKYIITGWISYA